MRSLHAATAGTLGPQDLMVEVYPHPGGNVIEITAETSPLFDEAIRTAASELLSQFELEGCRMVIRERNALDFVVRARIETALRRALGG